MPHTVVTCNASSITGVDNFGDELLRDVYGQWVMEAAPDALLHHASISQLGVLAAESRSAIRSASIVIFSGGGYFADGGGSDLQRHLRGLRNRSVYRSVYRLASRNGVPHAVLGLEVGPLASPLYRSTVRELLATACSVVVRNEDSRRNAELLLSDPRRIDVHLDAALAADARGLTGLSDEGAGAEVNIGIHVHEIADAATGGLLVELIRMVARQAGHGRPVRVHFLHDQRKRGRHSTGATAAEGFLQRSLPALSVQPYQEPAQTVAAISRMDLVVTSKLHVGVVARSLGVPALAIGRHPKIRRFYESLGEADLCADVAAIVGGEIPERALVSVRSAGRSRLPIDDAARRSALGNRATVMDLMRSMLVDATV